jgi:anti-anti-sigma factor
MTSAASSQLTGGLNALVISGRVDADRAALTPRGELVHGCAETLAKALADLPAGVTRVDLDMGDVHFMDTAGLQFLEVLRDCAGQRALTVTTTNWNGQPRRILELAGLDTTDPVSGPATTAPARTPHGPAAGPREAPPELTAAAPDCPATEPVSRRWCPGTRRRPAPPSGEESPMGFNPQAAFPAGLAWTPTTRSSSRNCSHCGWT